MHIRIFQLMRLDNFLYILLVSFVRDNNLLINSDYAEAQALFTILIENAILRDVTMKNMLIVDHDRVQKTLNNKRRTIPKFSINNVIWFNNISFTSHLERRALGQLWAAVCSSLREVW
jgi:hypothetical protein